MTVLRPSIVSSADARELISPRWRVTRLIEY